MNNFNDFDVIPIEEPMSILFGPWGVALPGTRVMFASAATLEEAEALAWRLETHPEGGFVDPETGRHYFGPDHPKGAGRPSPEQTAEALRVYELQIGERAAAFVGVDPDPNGDTPWPPCFDWSRKNWKGLSPPYDGNQPLLYLAPERVLTCDKAAFAKALPADKRAIFNDLWGVDVLEQTWPKHPLDAGPWHELAALWDDVWDVSIDLTLRAVFDPREGKEPPSAQELGAAHMDVVVKGSKLLQAREDYRGVSDFCRRVLVDEIESSSRWVLKLSGYEVAEDASAFKALAHVLETGELRKSGRAS